MVSVCSNHTTFGFCNDSQNSVKFIQGKPPICNVKLNWRPSVRIGLQMKVCSVLHTCHGKVKRVFTSRGSIFVHLFNTCSNTYNTYTTLAFNKVYSLLDHYRNNRISSFSNFILDTRTFAVFKSNYWRTLYLNSICSEKILHTTTKQFLLNTTFAWGLNVTFNVREIPISNRQRQTLLPCFLHMACSH